MLCTASPSFPSTTTDGTQWPPLVPLTYTVSTDLAADKSFHPEVRRAWNLTPKRSTDLCLLTLVPIGCPAGAGTHYGASIIGWSPVLSVGQIHSPYCPHLLKAVFQVSVASVHPRNLSLDYADSLNAGYHHTGRSPLATNLELLPCLCPYDPSSVLLGAWSAGPRLTRLPVRAHHTYPAPFDTYTC